MDKAKSIFTLGYEPGIIPRQKTYEKYIAAVKKRDFYACKGKDNILSYLSRISAIDKTSKQEAKAIENFIKNSAPGEAKNILGYAGKRPGSTGLFGKNGDLEKKDLTKIKKTLQTTGSNIWHGVLSFRPEFCCNSKEEAQEVLAKQLKLFFNDKFNHLDHNNIDYIGAFHRNTENPHIHLIFWEKEAKHISRKGNPAYTWKGTFAPSLLTNVKVNTVKQLLDRDYDLIGERNALKDLISRSINRTVKPNQKSLAFLWLSDLGRRLPKGGRLQYNADNMAPFRKEIDNITNFLITSDPAAQLKFNQLVGELSKRQKAYNNVDGAGFLAGYKDTVVSELYGRFGQEIIRQAFQANKDKPAPIGKAKPAQRIHKKLQRQRWGRGFSLAATSAYIFDRFLSRLEEEKRKIAYQEGHTYEN